MKRFLKFLALITVLTFCAIGFSACVGVEFKINFVVDGEIYAIVNTNGRETIKMPANPTKEDYNFDGWFWDNDTWEKPFTANSLLDAPLSSDMSVYAKFKPNHTHEYTEQITKEPTCTEKGEKIYTCECGYSYAEEIKELGHEFTDYVSDNNATYEHDGTKTALCNHGCGATDTITDKGTKIPEITEYFTKQADGTYYGKVYNTTKTFDFKGKINYDGEYYVCTDAACTKPLNDNKTSINVGDNTFYILFDNGNKTTATVRRRVIYSVNFNSAGGTAVSSQNIEEDRHAVAPKNPMRVGYTFNAWDRDFNEPITANTTITALWNANTNTPYKIEYYLQNLNDDNYTLQENDTEYLTGTTDTTARATKTYEHFTVKENTASANINPDGTRVLKVYYMRDKYNVKILASNDGVDLSHSFNGQYKYGYIIPEIQVNVKLGYEWQGWYSNNEFMTNDTLIPSFTVDKNINYIARYPVKPEMSYFDFTATATTCTITDLKDTTITKIVIPDYVTRIGDYAFYNCTSLQSITIPESVTSIGNNAFAYCSSLTSIIIPESVTIIERGAFFDCSSLTNITLPNSITSIGRSAFVGCSNLHYNKYDNGLYLGNDDNPYLVLVQAISNNILSCNVSEKTKIICNSAFSDCSSLTSITITDSITRIENDAFYNCNSLTIVNYNGTIDSWCEIYFNSTLFKVTYALYINDELIEEANITEATAINNYAFSFCSSLTSITISDSVKSIGSYAFYGCSALTSITIPESVTSIGNNAFAYCSSLTSIIIPESMTSIEGLAFFDCSSLTNITLPNSIISIGGYAFAYCSSLTSITIPESVTSIGNNAFAYCSSLTSIIIPESMTSIERGAFYNCTSLQSITFKNLIGWRVSKNDNMNNATTLSFTAISNMSTAANYLKSTYGSYYWKRG